jgi:hypothetical protein
MLPNTTTSFTEEVGGKEIPVLRECSKVKKERGRGKKGNTLMRKEGAHGDNVKE